MVENFWEYCKTINFDFPAYYHKIGMQIKAGGDITDIIDIIIPEIPDSNILKDQLPKYLCSQYAYKALWTLNSINISDHTKLDEFSHFFKDINKVKRGGINTYKLTGWMVHVLYVFQLITHNIANGVIPSSFEGKPVSDTFSKLNEYYCKMSDTFKSVICVFALIHDIGVVDGVQHHDRDGEKYVEEVLLELGLNESFWRSKGLTFSDAVIILQVLVANHTLINKVSAEDSDQSILAKCSTLRKKLENVESRIDYPDIASCLFILGVSDLIAVDDSLYTVNKFKLAENSFQFLQSIFSNSTINRSEREVALFRLGEMVQEEVYQDLYEDTVRILKSHCFEYEQFCKNLFNIYRIEYATAFLKPLHSLEYTVIVLASMLNFLSVNYGSDEISKTTIVFDSAIDNQKLKKSLDENEFLKTMQLLSKDNSKVESMNIRICYDTHMKQLILSTV